MIGWFVGWLFCRSVGQSGRSVGWSVACLVRKARKGWLVGWLVDWWIGGEGGHWLIGWLVAGRLAWGNGWLWGLVDWSVGWLFGLF